MNANATAGFVGGPPPDSELVWPSWPILLGTVAAGYLILCSALRFRFENATRRRFNYLDRESFARMTNDDAQAILSDLVLREFPFMYNTALQFGIYKTYGIPAISKLLSATKALTDPTMAPKRCVPFLSALSVLLTDSLRYEDTTILFAEFSLNPPTSTRCLQALARMNYLHSRYKAAGQISNADFLYTLSVCITSPVRFLRLYEWRPLNDMECCALGVFWKSIGDAMGIEYAGYLARAGPDGPGWHDGLEFVQDVTEWSAQYERDTMRPDAASIAPSRRLVDMMLHFVPHAMRPFAVEVATVLMGERMRDAFRCVVLSTVHRPSMRHEPCACPCSHASFPEPGIVACTLAYSTLTLRRLVLRYLTLPRWIPSQLITPADPTTGRMQHPGYLVEPWYLRPTLGTRWGPMALLTRLLGGYVPVRPGDSGQAAKSADWLPEGYLFEDIGPRSRMGKGVAEMAADVERLRRQRPSGCPFA